MRRVACALSLLLVVAGGAALGACGAGTGAPASPTAVTYRIGITQIATHPALDEAVRGFREGLAAEGISGVSYEIQNAEGDVSTAVAIAQKFAAEELDLIYSVSTPATQAVTRMEKSVPVVFCAVTDPVGAGIVAGMAAPGGNVTGVSIDQPVEPILELIKRLDPEAGRIGMVYNPGEVNSAFMVKKVEAAAKPLGLTVVKAGVSTSAEVQQAALSLAGRVDDMLVIHDNTAVAAFESIVKVCDENQIPLFSGDTDNVRRGAAAGYSFDYADLGRRAARQAAQILRGTPPGDIPVERPVDLELAVNLHAAAAQGLELPLDVIDAAAHRF